MARNGSGTYVLPAGNPVTTGTTISSTWANTTLSDIGSALTGSISTDGQTLPTANLPMGNYAHTGVANATVRTQYASAGQVQDSSLTYLGSVSGTDTITASAALGMTAYTVGQAFRFVSAGANTTTAVTININGIGAKNITKNGTTALAIGDIPSGAALQIVYDGTQFQVTGISGVASFSAGTTGLTPSTATNGAVTLAGTLAPTNGGTGLTTFTAANNALYSTAAGTLTAGVLPVAAGGTGSSTGVNLWRNKIINGAMNVWQRGTTYALTTTSTYGSADRWAFYQPTSAAGIANRITSGLTGFQYDLKLGRTASSALTNNIYSVQALETANSIDMAGQSVTLSFYAKAGANYSGASNAFNFQVYSGTGTDQSAATLGSWTGVTNVSSGVATLTTSYQRFTVTGTVGSTATQIGIQLFYTPTGTAGADDNVYITGVQLEKGSTATSFEYRPYGTELALCQRYYYRTLNIATGKPLSNGAWVNVATVMYGILRFPVTMRIIPTSLDQSGTATDYIAYVGSTSTVCSAVPVLTGFETANESFTQFTVASGLTAGQSGYLRAATANGYLGWSAEL